MPQYPLDFRQLCPTFQHPPRQTVAQHMRGDIFQPPRQVYERLAACDVSLTLCLSAQVLCGASPKLSHRSLRHPLRDSYPGGLPFRRHRNSDQKPFSLLVTTKSRQSLWAAHALKIAAQQTRCIKMQRNTTRFACLATAHRQRATLQIKITQLHIADLLHTEPCIDEQCQKETIPERGQTERLL
jgi:hypothetical protein